MSTGQLQGDILTPQGFVRGVLEHERGRVLSIVGDPVPPARERSGAQPLILPGFIDLHVHGGGGSDIMEGGDATARVARLHARHGTTALLATTMTAPMSEITAAMMALAPAVRERPKGAAQILGVHLEGPYINPGKLGAQPSFARAASIAEIDALRRLAPIRVVTLAPELADALELIEQLDQAGIRVQIGHTLGDYDQGVAALRGGASGFTHLFNAMTGMHHREPGMVGAALAHAVLLMSQDLAHCRHLGEQARKRAVRHLSRDAVLQGFHGQMERALAARVQ